METLIKGGQLCKGGSDVDSDVIGGLQCKGNYDVRRNLMGPLCKEVSNGDPDLKVTLM